MKKVLYLMLLLSVVALGSENFEVSEEVLETYFEIEYPFITDRKIKLKDIEYNLTISQSKALLELEIESTLGDGNWSKLDKQAFEEVVLRLVRSIRTELDNPDLDVTVFVKLDRDFKDDQILFNKSY